MTKHRCPMKRMRPRACGGPAFLIIRANAATASRRPETPPIHTG
jgi:hypothetical protein